VVWFAAGAAAALAGACVFAYAWLGFERITTASAVHEPLLVALDEFETRAARSGDAELAASLEQFSRCWEAFAFAEGESPEQFARAVFTTGSAACRATRDASPLGSRPTR
jgi:hypothetical protein